MDNIQYEFSQFNIDEEKLFTSSDNVINLTKHVSCP